MIEVLPVMTLSKLRDSLDEAEQMINDAENGVILTHRGDAKFIAFSAKRWNTIVRLFKQYEDFVVLEQRGREMAQGHYHTREEAEAIFAEAGLLP
ncbi:MAG: hypothetical protein AAF702_01535 [Chloroflexota bacterium]